MNDFLLKTLAYVAVLYLAYVGLHNGTEWLTTHVESRLTQIMNESASWHG